MQKSISAVSVKKQSNKFTYSALWSRGQIKLKIHSIHEVWEYVIVRKTPRVCQWMGNTGVRRNPNHTSYSRNILVYFRWGESTIICRACIICWLTERHVDNVTSFFQNTEGEKIRLRKQFTACHTEKISEFISNALCTMAASLFLWAIPSV